MLVWDGETRHTHQGLEREGERERSTARGATRLTHTESMLLPAMTSRSGSSAGCGSRATYEALMALHLFEAHQSGSGRPHQGAGC